jgi:hypothetical protein
MAPRQRIAPVPYAMQLTDGIYVGGDGNVGVGTTEPSTRLHVKQLGGLPTARFEDGYGHGIDIDAYQYGANIDPLEAGDDIYMGRDTTLGQLKIESGTVHIDGDLDIKRKYQVFHEESFEDWTMQERALGQWDLCVVAAYEIAGVDDYDNHWGYCRVRPAWKPNTWGDDGPEVKSPGQRDSWYMNAQTGGNTDHVKCEAICFNIGE